MMISENELRDTLRHYAGPDLPVSPLVRRRRLRPAILAPALVAIAAGAGVLTFALTRSSSESGRGSSGGSCAAAVRFRGVDYLGNKLHGVTLVAGSTLGTAEQPPCGDTAGAQIDVVALRGVDPAVAIARPGERDVVYVARGRCAGFTDDRAFVACLLRAGT
jgi:uncharacterized protein DUF6281